MLQLRRATSLLVVSVFCIGCNDAAPSLSGSVTYNGSPVADGYVTFTPVESGTSFAAKVADGKYQAEKVYLGQYRALVTTNSNVAGPRTREEAAQQARVAVAQDTAESIPENAEGNGQTVEITDGGQTLDFAITGPPRQ